VVAKRLKARNVWVVMQQALFILHLRESIVTITVVLKVVPVGSSGFSFTGVRISQKNKESV